MLELTVSGEYFDDDTERFLMVKPKTVRLEHSLRSVAIWESKWKKSFLSTEQKTIQETVDYIRCMCLTDISELEFGMLINTHLTEIKRYIDSSQTATVINRPNHGSRSSEKITSELIYYWMFSAGIPADPCEQWHLSRLLTLIEIFGIKNAPKKRMKSGDVSKMYRSLNAQRRAKLSTNG